MDQLHKRFTFEQVKVLLQSYQQGTIGRREVEEVLQVHPRPLECQGYCVNGKEIR